MINGKSTLKKDKKKVAEFFRAKRQRRQKLASLPIEEKVKILVQLQKMAAPILVARGLKKKAWVL
jgi:hypothetical protein